MSQKPDDEIATKRSKEDPEKTTADINIDGSPSPEIFSPATTTATTMTTTTPTTTLKERFIRIKRIVKEAIDRHHTFMIYGKSRVIRESLLSRGWCEKFYTKNNNNNNNNNNNQRMMTSNGVTKDIVIEQQQQQQQKSAGNAGKIISNVEASPVGLLAGIGDLKDHQSERMLVSRMLADTCVDFLWNSGSEWAGWPSQDNKVTLFNRYCRAGFTSKIGLCANVGQMHWYYEADVANTLFPRCYNVSQADQMHAFVEDFRFTACLSLLKWLVDTINKNGENATTSSSSSSGGGTTIPLKALDFAIRRCTDYIGARSHEDIDRQVEKIWSHQWDQFISWYYQIVHGQALFVRNDVSLNKYFIASRRILEIVRKYRQQLDMDGIFNIWILKPGNKSRGRGIILIDKLEDVLTRINSANKTENRYVVQKYIERPMLVYGTKFDIRQWFIVTCAQPLTLWMYRESYLRFCSQNFRLDDFHESIHLCNNAIQCKYKNSPDRDPALPSDNMWDSTTFKQFLKTRGEGDAWDELIYPGMRQGLVGSLLASQEAMDRRKNSFELYGADFMIMDDFSVWLIEINSHPDMSNSSSVTTRLCRQVMEDTIKVVIDFRDDKKADTGLFELAYRQRMPNYQPYLGAALSLQGTRIIACERKQTNVSDSNLIVAKSPTIKIIREKEETKARHIIGPVIVDLIEELELQLDREFIAYSNNLETPSKKTRLVNLPIASAPAPAAPKLSSKSSFAPAVKSRITTALKEYNGIEKKNTKSPTSPDIRNVATNTASCSPARTKIQSDAAVASSSIIGRNLISKIVQLQRESETSSRASYENGRKSSTGVVIRSEKEQKVIDSAMREAVTKYKKYSSSYTMRVPAITATVRSSITNTARKPSPPPPPPPPPPTTGTTTTSRTRPRRSTQRKKKTLGNVKDMYAIGLGIKK